MYEVIDEVGKYFFLSTVLMYKFEVFKYPRIFLFVSSRQKEPWLFTDVYTYIPAVVLSMWLCKKNLIAYPQHSVVYTVLSVILVNYIVVMNN